MQYNTPSQTSPSSSVAESSTSAATSSNMYMRSALMETLVKERKVARDFQERKHNDWNENYELSRNKVRTNRLTQRQAVNVPLMKETEKTLLSKIDDAPNIEWKELGGDLQKEIIYQSIWDDQFKKQKFEWKDILDKKNVLRYGLSTKMLNIGDKGVEVSILDVWDIVFDPLMDPMDIETARFIVRQNIFRSLRDVLADSRYTEEAKTELKKYVTTTDAIIQDAKNKEELEKKQERLKAMGVNSDEFDKFSAGDVLLNLCEHYTKRWNTKSKKFERHVITYANDNVVLNDELLHTLIGVEFYPFVQWSEDPETNDIYPDSVDDLIRVPNKILNTWFSQLAENRTLKNFQMHWYDATKQGYVPQTYEPGPGRMLPAPGNPKDTIMPVEISGLDDTLAAIDFVIKMAERGSGATAIEKGQGEGGTQTLGEVEVLVGKATERTLAMQKFYRGSWYELAMKWSALMHANAPKIMKLYKIGRDGNIYPKSVYPSDWKSEFGYDPIVSSSSEQEQNDIKTVQKYQAVTAQYPDNPALRKISQKRQLEILDLTPEELREVEEAEDKLQEQKMQMMMAQNQPQPVPGQPQPTPQAVAPAQTEDLTPELEQLTSLIGA